VAPRYWMIGVRRFETAMLLRNVGIPIGQWLGPTSWKPI